MRPLLSGLLLGFAVAAVADEPPADQAAKLETEASQLLQQGRPAEAVAKQRQAVDILRALYPAAKYPAGHADLARGVNQLGLALRLAGAPDRALPLYEEALAMRRRLYPPDRFPDGHADVAGSLNNLGAALLAMGAADRARACYEESVAMYRRLYPAATHPAGHPALATGLNNLGAALLALGSAERALPHYEQALAMYRRLYPAARYPIGHRDLALGVNNVGHGLQAAGRTEQALPFFEEALAMFRRLNPADRYPAGHPDVALALSNVGGALRDTAGEKALPYFEQALAMYRRLYPPEKYPAGHPDLARALNNLGGALVQMGAAERALPHYEQALAMRRGLYPAARYPAGHPDVATGLTSLAHALRSAGAAEKAVPYYEEAVAMRRRLYPPERFPAGHPALARALGNLGGGLQAAKAAGRAVPHLEGAVAMYRRLYPVAEFPAGHPELAAGLNNLGVALQQTGAAERAAVVLGEALAMRQSLYPAGHLAVATSLDNLGHTLLSLGAADRAVPVFAEALAVRRRLDRQLLLATSEAEALAYLHDQLPTRDGYLSATQAMPGQSAAAYAAVWHTKAALTRLLAQRRAAAGNAPPLAELAAVRRRLDQVLQDRRLSAADRDKRLADLAADRDRLERQLAAAVPLLARARELDALGPADLGPLLPKGAALIDIVRYTQFTYGRGPDGKAAESRTPSYVAFVLAGGRPAARVELGAAGPIDAAIDAWRRAIDGRTDSPAAADLAKRVWAPLASALPPGTTTLYLTPDGDLARLPWAALPLPPSPGSAGDGPGGKATRVLLENYALAQVPHGPFLLEQLKAPRAFPGTAVLAVGGVDYGPSGWPALPGTRAEVDAVAALAAGRPDVVRAGAATAARVTALLPNARYAHLATHGEFQAAALAAERRRAEAARSARGFGEEVPSAAATNPLGYVGLVLAGGEVLSGLRIIDLPLDNLQLVTLSACETGLGESTGGEGVQGLARAFHLAGCPNVIASLWKVNDAATAALMAKFYHELWVNKRPPAEALRAAQLLVYRRPDLIPDLAGERGAPRLKAATAAELPASATGEPPASATGEPPASAGGGRRADTRLWAAFTLSGAGR